ncbi:electron transfer flavoprotein subunit alpha/FixB family protein [Arcanobacterium bovis]|uniref:Electron transfer flavoprotein subunit alpha/FixB family protein n=1 Tax=Arcanobacterium bovis TaxID=2529275 RepID=A0A4V2KRD4_9ACTO|nr:electron transfer flavoprotein subunit alpha/FixB family protein [Arcanobacterium bovis]TBW23884.1 electron transfer flavoprotein subunit alpha/FixB family protein [Arcanobacterium bovis]
MSVWVIASSSASISSVLAAAGQDANLLIVGDDALAAALAQAPVVKIVHVRTNTVAEMYAQAVGAWLAEQGAQTVLAADFAPERSLAAAATAAMNGTWISSAIAWDNSSRSATVLVAGLAHETVSVQGPVALTLPAGEIPDGGNAVVEMLELTPWDGVSVLETQPIVASSADLSRADRVIGVGRGIAEEKDLAMISELAEAIGAQVGATRPLAEGHGWFDSYIGLTGQTIAAELYLAIGVSGQIHHAGGIRDSKIIVAINEDPQAPIFQEADYGIIGDLYEVVPALQASL